MRKQRRRFIGAMGLALVSIWGGAFSQSPDDRAKGSLLVVQVAGQLVENHANETFVLPGPTQGLVPFASLRQTIDPHASRFFSDRDAWGHQILYWSDQVNYMIVSLGADGKPDFDYQQDPPFAGISPRLNTNSDQDIVLVGGAILRGPLAQRQDPRRTMADLRSIGTACEEYAIDNNFYPSSESQLVPVGSIAPHLEPVYIQATPRTDTWQQPILYWSNRSFYVILSTGADAAADVPYEAWQSGDFHSYYGGPVPDLRKDIIFRNGQFVQWPASIIP